MNYSDRLVVLRYITIVRQLLPFFIDNTVRRVVFF